MTISISSPPPSTRWRDVPTLVETNAPDTYAREVKRRPVGYHPSRAVDRTSSWMFTDGSGSGWYGLVVLRPGRSPRLIAREEPLTTSVAAEVNGLLLALDTCETTERVTVVSDYLWSIYYVLGWYDSHAPTLIEQVRRARSILAAKGPAELRYVHTRGHRQDGTDIGFWNHVADRLCDARMRFDGEVSEDALRRHLGARQPLRDLLRA
ncbi:MAG: hypothetical protein Q8M65_03250, partial [Rhodoglobus sp.]|nr:hypothetical protein [Rhodoglobus sp.]